MPSLNKPTKPLSSLVKKSLDDYFVELDGAIIGNIYELVIGEVEKPLLEVVLRQANGNQSKASKWLGISRNTLRKLIAKYNITTI